MSKECLVKGCGNRSDQGRFMGTLCAPCWKYLTTGEIGHTGSFLGDMQRRLDSLDQLLDLVECGEAAVTCMTRAKEDVDTLMEGIKK